MQSAAVATDEFIVTFKGNASKAQRDDALKNAGAKGGKKIGRLNMQKVDIPRNGQAKAIAELKGNGAVKSIDKNFTRSINSIPNDPRFGDQWNLTQIDWDDAYGVIDPAGTAVVAVLDTGVDTSHPDLAGQFADTSTFYNAIDPTSGVSDPNGHGTQMAGIIAANTNNATGIAGVAYDGVTVMPVTVMGANGTGTDIDIIAGINWAVANGADVILMAFSSPAQSSALETAVNHARNDGVTVVASVANDGTTAASYPAGYPGVIGVAATDQSDNLASFSNSGASAYIAAPGVDITTLTAGGGTRTIDGTSAAAASVAGVAGLLVADGVSSGNVAGRISSSADPTASGIGRLDVAAALGAADTGEQPDGDLSGPEGDATYQVSVGGDFQLDFRASEPSSYDHASGGGAWDLGTNNFDTVESLEGGDFVCGDIVTFLTQIVVDKDAVGSQTIELDYVFTAVNNGTPSTGLIDIVHGTVGINYLNIVDLLEADTVDDGYAGSGNENATLESEVVDPAPFAPKADLLGTVSIDGLEAGETIIVRVDVVLGCIPGTTPNGTLQGAISRGRVIDPLFEDSKDRSISVGDRTIPFNGIADIAFPTIGLTKDADPTTVYAPGDYVDFTVTVFNTTVTDDPNNTAAPFTPATVVSMVDDIYGDITSVQGDISATTCSVPQTLAPEGEIGDSYTCSFTALVSGAAGTSHTDTVTATEEFGDTGVDSATVTIEAPPVTPPVTQVIKGNADGNDTVATLDEPGGSVTIERGRLQQWDSRYG